MQDKRKNGWDGASGGREQQSETKFTDYTDLLVVHDPRKEKNVRTHHLRGDMILHQKSSILSLVHRWHSTETFLKSTPGRQSANKQPKRCENVLYIT